MYSPEICGDILDGVSYPLTGNIDKAKLSLTTTISKVDYYIKNTGIRKERAPNATLACETMQLAMGHDAN